MEAQQMATTKLSDEAFLSFLEKRPDLRDRFASIVSAGEDSEGNLKEADAAAERILEEMRMAGREAMQGWAERQVEVTEQEIRQQPQMHRQGKKNSAGIRNSARSRSQSPAKARIGEPSAAVNRCGCLPSASSVHSKNPLAGMMQRRRLKESRNIGFSAMVSARALNVAGTSFRLFFQK